MGITHVIRGEDLLSSTPRQVLVYQGLGGAGAVVRAPAAALRPRQEAPLEAPRRDERRGAARGRLSGRGGRQLPRPARLALRLRARALHARRADRPVLARARQPGAGRLRRQEARVDERRLPARAADVRPRRAPDRLPRASAARRSPPSPSGSSRSRRWRRRRSRRWPSSSRSARSSSGRSRSTRRPGSEVAGHERAAEILAAVQAALADCEWTVEGVEAALRGVCEQLELKPRVVFGLIRVAVTGTSISPGPVRERAPAGPRRGARASRRRRRPPRLAPPRETLRDDRRQRVRARPRTRGPRARRALPAAAPSSAARAPASRPARRAAPRSVPSASCAARPAAGLPGATAAGDVGAREAAAPAGGVGERRWRLAPASAPRARRRVGRRRGMPRTVAGA